MEIKYLKVEVSVIRRPGSITSRPSEIWVGIMDGENKSCFVTAVYPRAGGTDQKTDTTCFSPAVSVEKGKFFYLECTVLRQGPICAVQIRDKQGRTHELALPASAVRDQPE